MYPQAQLDAYAAMKNNIDAVGMIWSTPNKYQ